MNPSDVPSGDMFARTFTDAEIEAMIAGETVASSPAELTELIGSLRSEREATQPVPMGASLAEFVENVRLTPAQSLPGERRPKTLVRRPLVAKFAGAFGLLSVKLAVAASVAAASVGGAHMLGHIEVPGLPERRPQAPVESPTVIDDAPPSVPASVSPPTLPQNRPENRPPNRPEVRPPLQPPSPSPTRPAPVEPTGPGTVPASGCEEGLDRPAGDRITVDPCEPSAAPDAPGDNTVPDRVPPTTVGRGSTPEPGPDRGDTPAGAPAGPTGGEPEDRGSPMPEPAAPHEATVDSASTPLPAPAPAGAAPDESGRSPHIP